MSCQWTGEVGVETFCSYKLGFSSDSEMRKTQNTDIMTDFYYARVCINTTALLAL